MRIHFYVKSLDDLCDFKKISRIVIKNFPDYKMVLDYVYREELSKDIIDKIETIGFQYVSTYKRMVGRPKVQSNKFFSSVCLAEPKHAKEISQLLEDTFDPLTDHLPSKESLLNWISTNGVFIVKVNSDSNHEIAALTIFENISRTIVDYKYLVVREKYRSPEISSAGTNYMLLNNPHIRKIKLWVKTNNLAIIARHNVAGFRFDGLNSSIWVYDS